MQKPFTTNREGQRFALTSDKQKFQRPGGGVRSAPSDEDHWSRLDRTITRHQQRPHDEPPRLVVGIVYGNCTHVSPSAQGGANLTRMGVVTCLVSWATTNGCARETRRIAGSQGKPFNTKFESEQMYFAFQRSQRSQIPPKWTPALMETKIHKIHASTCTSYHLNQQNPNSTPAAPKPELKRSTGCHLKASVQIPLLVTYTDGAVPLANLPGGAPPLQPLPHPD